MESVIPISTWNVKSVNGICQWNLSTQSANWESVTPPMESEKNDPGGTHRAPLSFNRIQHILCLRVDQFLCLKFQLK